MIVTGGVEKHNKKWGYELWIHNDEQYCGKLLVFNKESQFSMHFHMEKNETWYVQEGRFELKTIDTETAEEEIRYINPGVVVYVPKGQPHQLKCLSDKGTIFEISTQHFEHDSYRIKPGDSQK